MVALVGEAHLDDRALRAAPYAGLLEDLVASGTGETPAVVTPAVSRESLHSRYLALAESARRFEAWVAAPEGPEIAPLILASADVRRHEMDATGRSEAEVWADAMAIATEHFADYLALLLPYPESEYRPSVEAAIDVIAPSLRGYARAVMEATFCGERHEHQVWVSDRHGDISEARATAVCRHVDRAISAVRYQHLPVGADVLVRCWADERVRPGRVCSVTVGASAPLVIEVAFPEGYESPSGSGETMNPGSYGLERIVEPSSPLRATARFAAAHGIAPPPRTFAVPGSGQAAGAESDADGAQGA